jgi:hypothetical protein
MSDYQLRPHGDYGSRVGPHQDHPSGGRPSADAGRSLAPRADDDVVLDIALDAAGQQMMRMRSSNPWDYARAVVRALREADLIKEAP